MQEAIYTALYPIQFSDLETALLPYFLFVVYGSIALWMRGVMSSEPNLDPVTPETPSPSPQPLEGWDTELEVANFVVSVPHPLNVDLMATEFDLEVRARSLNPMTDVVLEYQEQKARQPKKKAKTMAEVIALEFERTEPTPDTKALVSEFEKVTPEEFEDGLKWVFAKFSEPKDEN